MPRMGSNATMSHHIASSPTMSVPFYGRTRLAVPLVICVALAGCGAFNAATQHVAQSVTPYKLEIVQGNFVSAEQVQLLKIGQTRAQVKDILGTPMVSSVFRGERWDYAFNLRRQGLATQARKLTVYFKGDTLERFEGDTMPTEAEFVASLANLRKDVAVPPLEATPEQLRAVDTPAAPALAEPVLAPLPSSYPPLEQPASK